MCVVCCNAVCPWYFSPSFLNFNKINKSHSKFPWYKASIVALKVQKKGIEFHRFGCINFRLWGLFNLSRFFDSLKSLRGISILVLLVVVGIKIEIDILLNRINRESARQSDEERKKHLYGKSILFCGYPFWSFNHRIIA